MGLACPATSPTPRRGPGAGLLELSPPRCRRLFRAAGGRARQPPRRRERLPRRLHDRAGPGLRPDHRPRPPGVRRRAGDHRPGLALGHDPRGTSPVVAAGRLRAPRAHPGAAEQRARHPGAGGRGLYAGGGRPSPRAGLARPAPGHRAARRDLARGRQRPGPGDAGRPAGPAPSRPPGPDGGRRGGAGPGGGRRRVAVARRRRGRGMEPTAGWPPTPSAVPHPMARDGPGSRWTTTRPPPRPFRGYGPPFASSTPTGDRRVRGGGTCC